MRGGSGFPRAKGGKVTAAGDAEGGSGDLREFLGWSRPIEESATEWLWRVRSDEAQFQSRVACRWVFSNRRRAIRFRQLLDVRYREHGLPPVIPDLITVADLPSKAMIAGGRQDRLATESELGDTWATTLKDAQGSLEGIESLLGERRPLSAKTARILGDELCRAIRILREHRLLPAQVAEVVEGEAEAARWRAIADLERLVRGQFRARGLCTPEDVMEQHLLDGETPRGSYICVGITDCSRQCWDELRRGCKAVLVEAPSHHSADFDEMGGPVESSWCRARDPIPLERITIGLDLPSGVEAAVETWGEEVDPASITVCHADPTLFPGANVDRSQQRSAIETAAGRAICAWTRLIRALPNYRLVEEVSENRGDADGRSEAAGAASRVQELAEVAAAVESVAGGGFFGRVEELRSLRSAWESAAAGEGPRFVLIAAESGIGKSRLVQALYEQLSGDDRWDPPGVDYWPPAFRRLDRGNEVNVSTKDHQANGPPRFMWLGMSWQMPSGDGPEMERSIGECPIPSVERILEAHVDVMERSRQRWIDHRRVRGAVETVMGDGLLEVAGSWLPGVGPLIRMGRELAAAHAATREAETTVDEKLRRQVDDASGRVYTALRALLRGDEDAVRMPTVLWLDDAQWMDPDSSELIHRLWAQAEQYRWPLLIVATHWEREWLEQRASVTPTKRHRLVDLIDHIGFEELYLKPATGAELAGHLDRELPGLTPSQRGLMLDRAGGNYLTLVESVGELRDISEEAFVGGDHRGALTDEGETVVREWSGTREERVRDRFNKLKPGLRRRILAVGTRLGNRFLSAVVERIGRDAPEVLSDTTIEEVRRELDNLTQPLAILSRPAESMLFREFRDVAFFQAAREYFERFVKKHQTTVDQAFKDVAVEWINASFDARGHLKPADPDWMTRGSDPAVIDLSSDERLALLESCRHLIPCSAHPDWSEASDLASFRCEFLLNREWGRMQLWSRFESAQIIEFPEEAVAPDDVDREIRPIKRVIEARAQQDHDAPDEGDSGWEWRYALEALARHHQLAEWLQPENPEGFPSALSGVLRRSPVRRLGDLVRWTGASSATQRSPFGVGARQVRVESTHCDHALFAALQRLEASLADWASEQLTMSAWLERTAAWVESLPAGHETGSDLDADEERVEQETTDAVVGALERLAAEWRGLDQMYSAADAMELVESQLLQLPLPGRRNPCRIELVPWERAREVSAEAIVIAGLHDAAVPGGAGVEPLLPESLRRRLGLPGHEQRIAQAGFTLALLHGRARLLQVVIPQRAVDGTPLLPSRLLLGGEGETLARRVLALTGGETGGETASVPPEVEAPSSGFAPPLPDPTVALPDRLSITAIRTYLADPYRFYLRYVEGLEESVEGGGELDALAFGTFAHAVVQAAASSEDWKQATTAEDLAGVLEANLDATAASWFGVALPVALRLELQSLRRRLGQLAEREAASRAAGWRTESVEAWIDAALDLGPGEAPQRVTGRIDRIDRNFETGRLRILDYETGDRAPDPATPHRVGRPPNHRWIDLQLPLCRHLHAVQHGLDEREIDVGCVTLATGERGVDFRMLAEWSEADFAEAIEKAREVVRSIRERKFARDGGDA